MQWLLMLKWIFANLNYKYKYYIFLTVEQHKWQFIFFIICLGSLKPTLIHLQGGRLISTRVIPNIVNEVGSHPSASVDLESGIFQFWANLQSHCASLLKAFNIGDVDVYSGHW